MTGGVNEPGTLWGVYQGVPRSLVSGLQKVLAGALERVGKVSSNSPCLPAASCTSFLLLPAQPEFTASGACGERGAGGWHRPFWLWTIPPIVHYELIFFNKSCNYLVNRTFCGTIFFGVKSINLFNINFKNIP